ncbi:MAG TPA: zinc-binding dehydrogenase, partial [Streptomyces sp.]|uniref:zinc-binding dehydrogenase n=1 Tax=Streptomyces sp. TaxID=1931 RepID=UPI002C698FF2
AASADELDRPQGWDLVIDATGNAAAIQDGLDRVAKAGTFLQFGVADYATRVQIDPYRIYNQEITITGSMAVLHSYERAAALFATGVLDPAVFISDRLPLEQYPQAIDRFKAGIGRKIVVEP